VAGISGNRGSVVYILLLVVVVGGGIDEHFTALYMSLFFELPPRPACFPPIAPPTIAPIKTRITRTTIASPFFVLQNG